MKNYSFVPRQEARKPQEETIRKLEKMCGKPIELFVCSLHTSWYWKKYDGQVERTGAGYYFRGNDGAMDYQCKMFDLLRNPKFQFVEIHGVKGRPSSSSH